VSGVWGELQFDDAIVLSSISRSSASDPSIGFVVESVLELLKTLLRVKWDDEQLNHLILEGIMKQFAFQVSWYLYDQMADCLPEKSLNHPPP
jgi:hypothetical protein